MTNAELMKKLHFDQTDLEANRDGRLSPRQMEILDSQAMGSRPFGIFTGIIIVLVALAGGPIVGMLVGLATSSSGQLAVAIAVALLWIIGFGVLGVRLIMGKRDRLKVHSARSRVYRDPEEGTYFIIGSKRVYLPRGVKGQMRLADKVDIHHDRVKGADLIPGSERMYLARVPGAEALIVGSNYIFYYTKARTLPWRLPLGFYTTLTTAPSRVVSVEEVVS